MSAGKWKRWRRASQLFIVLFFLALPVSNRLGQYEVLGNLASLQIGPIHMVDPATGISSILAARTVHTTLITGFIIPFLLAFALGPVFCSWVCPWGFLSEGIDRLLKRRVIKQWKWLGKLRWTTLALFFLLSFGIGVPLVATFSAPRLITQLPFEIIFLGALSNGTLTLLALLLLLEFVLPRRLWCRALCPVGSLLVLLRLPWTMTIRWRRSTCEVGKVLCVRNCPWNLDPRRMGWYDGCTNCGGCIDACPGEPARSLSWTGGDRGDRGSFSTITPGARHPGDRPPS